MAENKWSKFLAAANAVAAVQDADVLMYNGRIQNPEDDTLIAEVGKRTRRKNVLLLLVTNGGEPGAAYRIARCLQAKYKRVTLLVSGPCMSSGTLIALGADELVMSDHAALGPLDIQMGRKDEVWEMQSGLTVQSALSSLQERAYLTFEHFMLKCRGSQFSTKIAADVAVRCVTGLFSGLYSQIDPMHVGEAARSTSISNEYGDRLSSERHNLKDGALGKLIGEYPSHGFVIDRKEAADLFTNVREPRDEESALLAVFPSLVRYPMTGREPWFTILSSEVADHPTTEPGKPTTGGDDDALAPPPEVGDGNGTRPEDANGEDSANEPATAAAGTTQERN